MIYMFLSNNPQGSYASGKCQGNLNFFKVRELSGNFVLCQGKMNVFKNVREMSGNFKISSLHQMLSDLGSFLNILDISLIILIASRLL